MLLFLALTLQPIVDAAGIESPSLSTQPKTPEREPMVRRIPRNVFNDENQMERKEIKCPQL